MRQRGAVPRSGLSSISSAAVAKSVDAPDLESGGHLANTRPVGVRLPSAAPHSLVSIVLPRLQFKYDFG